MIVDLRAAGDVALCGGKAARLGELLRAGFDVPGGFVVTTAGCALWQRSSEKGGGLPGELRGAVSEAYRKMREGLKGSGRFLVAVRSSATAEDMAEASMAGQYATHLNVGDEAGVMRAVELCFLSLDSARTRAYLGQHGLVPEAVAMAVVVQRQAEAAVAGVLFTANPHTGDRGQMVIESTWGLGEALVSGITHPDTFVVGMGDGKVVERHIADKSVEIVAGASGTDTQSEVGAERRMKSSLTEEELGALHELAGKVVKAFDGPQDVEWALERRGEGEWRLWVLQARPITTLGQADAYQRLLKETRGKLEGILGGSVADGGSLRGPLVLHNLAETLPHPTELTWSVIGPFMSGRGGFGKMYRMAGFGPSRAAEEKGFLELVAGKIYMDASRATEMFFGDFPYRYDPHLLQKDPDAAQSPPTVPTGSVWKRMRANRKVKGAERKLSKLARTFERELSEREVPEFVKWCEREEGRDLAGLRGEELQKVWEARRARVLDDFAPKSLLPSLIAGQLADELRGFIAEWFWADETVVAGEAAQLLVTPREMDKTLESNCGLHALGRAKEGEREEKLRAWMKEFGHRGPEEFDLAAARWRERGEAVGQLAERVAKAPDPAERHREHTAEVKKLEERLREKLGGRVRKQFEELLDRTRKNMLYRENGKFYLMRGYALLREVALEAGRRLGVKEDVFLLRAEEMWEGVSGRLKGSDLRGRMGERKLRRHAEKRLQLPHFIESAEVVGGAGAAATEGAREMAGAEAHTRRHVFQAFCLSRGVATGAARIVLTPEEAATRDLGEKYVLVCPSTDPNWTPLFMNAVGLVLERGGSLSHGAVVAREMGIPAVVLREATTLLRENERVAVDADGGKVLCGENAAAGQVGGRVKRKGRRERIPPVGAWERWCNRMGLWMGAGGAVMLALVFLLPERVWYWPAMEWIDAVLWPLVRSVGRPWTVGIVGGGMAAVVILLQRVLTDTKRLREAKARGARGRKGLAAEVQGRLLASAIFPVAVLLVPMVLIFAWMPARMDPAGYAPAPLPPGVTATVVATVAADWPGEVLLTVPPRMAVEGEKAQRLPRIRETLEGLLKEMEGDAQASQEEIADLREYLRKGIPPQTVQWKVRMGAGMEGSQPVIVSVLKEAKAEMRWVFFTVGERDAPGPRVDDGAGWMTMNRQVLLKVELVPGPAERREFGKPLHWTGVAGLKEWDSGWLMLYLLAYLPVMLVGKRVLNVP